MCADGEGMEEMRESHRGMVDGCRWNGGEWDTGLPVPSEEQGGEFYKVEY